MFRRFSLVEINGFSKLNNAGARAEKSSLVITSPKRDVGMFGEGVLNHAAKLSKTYLVTRNGFALIAHEIQAVILPRVADQAVLQ